MKQRRTRPTSKKRRTHHAAENITRDEQLKVEKSICDRHQQIAETLVFEKRNERKKKKPPFIFSFVLI